MKIVTYSCDAENCKYSTQDKKNLITYVKFTVKTIGKKVKAVRHEEHFCSEDCLRKTKGWKEVVIAKEENAKESK